VVKIFPIRPKHILRRIIEAGKPRYELDITGKKASIIKLCQEGKLKRRKCRKYKVY